MAKDVDELTFTYVPAEEVSKTLGSGRKALSVQKLANKFVDPETKEPIPVGAAVDIGPFDNEAEGKNWIKYLVPDMYQLLKWHENKKNKFQRVVSTEPMQKEDGKVYIRVIRLV